eukprot:CAMPEP_0182831326 /NCGR_PEP_ID=MMETSP0006_2-20121128/19066_1 /TAXON_ID=97485 /ORGANISM="Prymnesium parvum, Strain Texoma1" /LENGTH=74 /DNA_ID=CAMNT_0024958987 /DNA_START=370 /DNA_END=594 /DNA_ORIENTATION=-
MLVAEEHPPGREAKHDGEEDTAVEAHGEQHRQVAHADRGGVEKQKLRGVRRRTPSPRREPLARHAEGDDGKEGE